MGRATLKEYRVQWEVELYATSPRAAAQKALEIQRDPESTASVFDVYRIDLDPDADAARLLAQSAPVRIDLERHPRRGKR